MCNNYQNVAIFQSPQTTFIKFSYPFDVQLYNIIASTSKFEFENYKMHYGLSRKKIATCDTQSTRSCCGRYHVCWPMP